MVFKKISAIGSALVLALSFLLTLVFTTPVQAAGTTLYWCEFGSNANWSIATDWNTSSTCSGGTQEAPVSGDALVFNNSTLTSTLDLNNDISGLDIASITFEGNGSGAYVLSGDAISLDGGITDSISTAQNDSISMNINLTANQTFTNNQAADNLTLGGIINLGANNLTLATRGTQLPISGNITGSGTLTLASPPTGSSTAYYIFNNADTSFSGPVVINAGAIGEDNSNSFNAFGSGLITVNNGGVLLLKSTASTGTLANNLDLAGSGISASGLYALTSCLAYSGGCTTANTTLTLPGKVTLSGNTVLVNGAYIVNESSPPVNNATFNFTGGGLYNGYTLTALTNTNTTVNDPTPILPSSGPGGSSAGTKVKAPNTGEGLAKTNVYLPIIGAALMAGSLIVIATVIRKRFAYIRVKK